MRSSLFIGLVSISLQKLSHRGTRGNHAGVLDCTACYQTFLIPPANEVWGKVIFSEASVILFTGGKGGSAYRGVCLRGRLPTGEGSVSGVGEVGRPPCNQESGGMHPTGMLSYYESFCSPTAPVNVKMDARMQNN